MSQTIDTRPVRCINEALGDPVVFDSLSEMEQAVAQLCDASTGESYMPEDGLVEGRDFEYMTMLMNPATGSVAPREEWEQDFREMTAEEWGGDTFESAGLVEVEPDGTGWWKEV